jgi:pimeloyl-ACP methyl ester carboxylesterase
MINSDMTLTRINTTNKIWTWRGFPISYQTSGDKGVAVVLVHGFGASSQHWRKNMPVLGTNFRTYAIDLIGFGNSAKPLPSATISYTFETWSELLADFCREVVKTPAFLVGNSIGCIVTMQTAVDYPDLVLGIASLNFSLRLLHERKRKELPWYRNFGAGMMQNILGNRVIGNFFFQQIAQPKVVKKILLQAYGNKEAVTDELVDILIKPAQDKGAADVFLAFTRYSQGPLAEDLLPLIECSVLLIWGENDPWEPIELAKEFTKFASVQKFISLSGIGHCPQDEAPEQINQILRDWIMELDKG